jgi:hypothetical protein
MRLGCLSPIPFENLQFILPLLKIRSVILKAKDAFKDDFYVTFLPYFSKLFPSLSVSSFMPLYTAVPFVPMRRINYQVNGIFMKWNLKNLRLTGISRYFSFQSTGNFLPIFSLLSSLSVAAYCASSPPIQQTKETCQSSTI